MDSSKYKAKYLLTYLLVDNQHIVHTYTVSQKSSRRTVVHNFAQSLNTDLFSNLFTCTISRKFAIKSCENNRQPCGSRSIINGSLLLLPGLWLIHLRSDWLWDWVISRLNDRVGFRSIILSLPLAYMRNMAYNNVDSVLRCGVQDCPMKCLPRPLFTKSNLARVSPFGRFSRGRHFSEVNVTPVVGVLTGGHDVARRQYLRLRRQTWPRGVEV